MAAKELHGDNRPLKRIDVADWLEWDRPRRYEIAMANRITRTALTVCIAASLTIAMPLAPRVVHAQDRHDEVALMQLESLLMNDVARRAAASQSEEGMKANQQLESMPPYAQKEVLGIVMAIMKEKREAASEHVDAFQASELEAARGTAITWVVYKDGRRS